MPKIELTKHARKRLKQRLGIPSRAHKRHAQTAFDDGLTRGDLSGSAKRYVVKAYHNSRRRCNNIRIYGRYIYMFADHVLITVFSLPNKYHKAVDSAVEKAVKDDNDIYAVDEVLTEEFLRAYDLFWDLPEGAALAATYDLLETLEDYEEVELDDEFE